MWQLVGDIQRSIERTVLQMDMKDWAIFIVVMITLGVFCMRGVGALK